MSRRLSDATRPARARPPDSWHGAILAGGEAKRFGSDKVFASIEGRRLIDLAVASLVGADGVSVLLGSHERRSAVEAALPDGVTGLADDVPGMGPMGGLATVLARHPDSWVALLAADMPLVPPEWWVRLATQHRRGAVAVVPLRVSGRWEPLAALYHGALGPEVADAIGSGDPARLALHTWLDSLERAGRIAAVSTDALPEGALRNVNRPDDAEAVAEALRAMGAG